MGDIYKRKNTFSFAIIQSSLIWEDCKSNLNYFSEQINALKSKVDLVVLPETFSTGFTMNVESFADEKGETLKWMIHQARENHVFLAGSIIVKENKNYYNRLYWVTPEGNVEYYNKRHLFRMGREQEFFTPGDDRVIVNIGKVRILLQICYDLRFPVFARNRGDYDVILYVANWPTARQLAWETLLPARAVENISYVIAANRSGIDGEGDGTCGVSMFIDPKGKIKARLTDQPGLLVSSVNLEVLDSLRKNFPAQDDADDFTIL
jgi:omega-amidase